MKENREQSLILFLLQTSLSLSYLLHNSMSKELFGEASKRRNNKKKKKDNQTGKIGSEISDVKLYTVNFSDGEWILDKGLGDISPPPLFITHGQRIQSSKERKANQLSSIQYRVQKKQDPLSIVLSCSMANCKDIQKKKKF